MKYAREQMAQRGHHYAIVDEVDSILVDEARTPLIISGPSDDRSALYETADKLIPLLGRGRPSTSTRSSARPTFTDQGIEKLEAKHARGPA